MGGGSSQAPQVIAAPAAPTLDNSAEALKLARDQQLAARGSAATLLTSQIQPIGSSSLLSSGSTQTRKMTLGT